MYLTSSYGKYKMKVDCEINGLNHELIKDTNNSTLYDKFKSLDESDNGYEDMIIDICNDVLSDFHDFIFMNEKELMNN